MIGLNYLILNTLGHFLWYKQVQPPGVTWILFKHVTEINFGSPRILELLSEALALSIDKKSLHS